MNLSRGVIRFLIVFLCSVSLIALCAAQYPVAWDTVGKIGPESTNRTGYRFDVATPVVPVADRAPFTAMAKQVFGILLAMPSLAQPRGFDVLTFASAESVDVEEDTGGARPHRVLGYMRIRTPVYLNADGRVISSQEAFAVEITVVSNGLKRLVSQDKSIQSIEDEQGKMYFPMPKATGTSSQGYPQWGPWTVITHRKAPMFIPVTRERILEAEIAAASKLSAGIEKGLAESKATMEAARKSNPELYAKIAPTLESGQKNLTDQLVPYRKFIADTKSQLAAMPLDQRRAPASIKLNYQPCCSTFLLASTGEQGAQDVFALNPQFFDMTLPATAPQILTVMISAQVPWPKGKLDQTIASELDWKALEAMLK